MRRQRLVALALVVVVIVGDLLVFQLGRTSEQIGDNTERIERLDEEMFGTPTP